MMMPMARPREMANVIQSVSWAAMHFSGTVESMTPAYTAILGVSTRS